MPHDPNQPRPEDGGEPVLVLLADAHMEKPANPRGPTVPPGRAIERVAACPAPRVAPKKKPALDLTVESEPIFDPIDDPDQFSCG